MGNLHLWGALTAGDSGQVISSSSRPLPGNLTPNKVGTVLLVGSKNQAEGIWEARGKSEKASRHWGASPETAREGEPPHTPWASRPHESAGKENSPAHLPPASIQNHLSAPNAPSWGSGAKEKDLFPFRGALPPLDEVTPSPGVSRHACELWRPLEPCLENMPVEAMGDDAEAARRNYRIFPQSTPTAGALPLVSLPAWQGG